MRDVQLVAVTKPHLNMPLNRAHWTFTQWSVGPHLWSKKLLFFTQNDLAFWMMDVNNPRTLMSCGAIFPHCSSPDIHNPGQLEVQSEDQASLHNPQSIRLLFIEVWSTWPVPRCLDKNCRHLHNDTLRTKPTTPDLYMEVVRAMECLCLLLHVSPPFLNPLPVSLASSTKARPWAQQLQSSSRCTHGTTAFCLAVWWSASASLPTTSRAPRLPPTVPSGSRSGPAWLSTLCRCHLKCFT